MNKLQKLKSVMAIMLIITMTAGILVSCGEKTQNNPGGDNQENAGADNREIDAESAAVIEDEGYYDDDLGDFDFKGYKFNFLTRTVDFLNCAIDYEEITGEVLEDAIYERNRRIEERFNIEFNNITTYDSSKAKNSIKAGSNDYDIIMTRNPDAFTVFAQEGLIHGLDSLTYIDLDKPYWDNFLTEELSVANQRYFAVGAFNLSAYDFVHVLIFNKNLISKYGMESPYEKVKSGTWTFDAFEQMAKEATRSLTGSDKMTKEDAYGFLSAPKQILPGFWISAGLKSIEKNDADLPYSAMGTEKFLEVFQRIYAMTWDNNSWFVTTSGENIPPELLTMFQNDQGLFMDCTFFYLKSLRSMESDFGILPYPKYNAQQDKYYSRMEGCELFFTPISAPQDGLDRTSVILEALSSDSAKTVVPVYYDVALKTKFTRDDESAEIIDILFENRVFDLGDTAWCDKVRDPIFAEMFKKNNRDLVSKLDSLDKTVGTLIDKTVVAFESLY